AISNSFGTVGVNEHLRHSFAGEDYGHVVQIHLEDAGRARKSAQRMEMFSVIGLTLDEVSTGSLPHVHLAKTLENRMTKSDFRFGEIILVYTTVETDTQGLVARTKYREQGQFLVFLYFNDVAVEACKEIGIPIRVLDRINETPLPSPRPYVP